MPETVSTPIEQHVERLQDVPTLLTSGERLYSPAGVAKAAKNISGHRGGPHLNGSTIFRYITKLKVINGVSVRLEAVRCGDRWLTSVEALNRYFARLTAAALTPAADTPPAPTGPTPKQRQRAAEKASREADNIFGGAKSGE